MTLTNNMQTNRQHVASFFSKKKVSPGAYEVTLNVSDDFAFKAGQYIWLELPRLRYKDPKGNRRGFSIISSTQNKKQIAILFRTGKSGFKDTLLLLKKNATVKVFGPFGSAYFVRPEYKKVVMIAGGVGVAPFLSIVRSRVSQKEQPRLSLVHFTSKQDTNLYEGDLKKQCRRNNTLLVLRKGLFTTDPLPRSVKFRNDIFFICGSSKFVNVVAADLSRRGVRKRQMHFEQFYPMPEGNLTEKDIVSDDTKSSVLLRAIQDSRHHVIITDANGTIVFANKMAEQNTGYTLKEMRDNTPRLWGGIMTEKFYSDLWRDARRGVGFNGEITNRRKNGEIYHVIAHISPIFGKKKQIIGFIGTEEDVTERIQLEEQLKESHLQYQAITNNFPNGTIAFFDRNLRYVKVGGLSLSNMGLSIEKLQGKTIRESFPKDIAEKMEKPLHATLGGGETSQEIEMNRRQYIVRNLPLKDAHGEVYGIISMSQDITREKEIDAAKTEFVSLASHQLRTPLSAIKWYSELLLDGDSGQMNKEQNESLKEIAHAGQRMINLVNSLLNVSRIDTGKLGILPQKVSVKKIYEDVVKEFEHTITTKKLKLSTTFGKIPSIMLDPNLMSIVFQNLLSNAIKYTNAGGKISVIAVTSSKDLRIEVKDNGCGIPARDQEKIFSKLHRAENAQKIDPEGTGLGLYIVRAIVQQSHGTISFTSKQGKGTTFIVTLPLKGMPTQSGSKTLVVNKAST